MKEFKQLFAFVILCLCIVSFAGLTMAVINRAMDKGTFFFLLAVTSVITVYVTKWLDNHFVDGEWK